MEAHCGLAPFPGADKAGIIASIRNVDRNKALERELRQRVLDLCARFPIYRA